MGRDSTLNVASDVPEEHVVYLQMLKTRMEADANNEVSVAEVCSFLAVYTSKHDRNAVLVVEHGFLPLLNAVLKRHCSCHEAVLHACNVFSFVAARDELRRKIADSGSIRLLFSVLRRHLNCSDIVQFVCAIMRGVAGHENLRDAIVLEGDLSVLVSSLQNHSSNSGIVRDVCGTMNLVG